MISSSCGWKRWEKGPTRLNSLGPHATVENAFLVPVLAVKTWQSGLVSAVTLPHLAGVYNPTRQSAMHLAATTVYSSGRTTGGWGENLARLRRWSCLIRWKESVN